MMLYLLANVELPVWITVLIGVGSMFGFGGIVLALLNRVWKRRDDTAAGDLTLATLNLKTLAEAREQWRKDIHDQRNYYDGEMGKMRVELELLKEDNENLKATHVEMYMAIRANQEFFDTMRLRAKEGVVTFSIDELPPHIDLASISPANAFRRRKSQTQMINLRLEQTPPTP